MNLGRFFATFLRGLFWLAVLASTGCFGSPTPPPRCVDHGPVSASGAMLVSERLILLDHLTFAEQASLGITDGLDLDHRVSDDTDALSCFQADFTSPTGALGIDNQFTSILPQLSDIVGTDLTATQLGASDLSEGLPVISLVEWSDGSVEASFVSAATTSGSPVRRDAAGTAVPLQSLCVQRGSAQTFYRASPDGAQPPLTIAALALPLRLANDHGVPLEVVAATADVRVELGSGAAPGMVAGAISVDELMRITRLLGLGRLDDLVRGIYETAADLEPDAMGMCQGVSFGMVGDAAEMAPTY